jgi:hypothetical protein
MAPDTDNEDAISLQNVIGEQEEDRDEPTSPARMSA